MPQVDVTQLAIDRGGSPPLRASAPRRWFTRYIFPATLLSGFSALLMWAVWDVLFPPRPVTVVPVLSTQTAARPEGTPLFKAAGWIEPRPTPVRVAALAPGVVEQLLVVEDQPVDAGEVIAELVKDDAQLALRRAEADLELRIAELEEARAALQAARTRMDQPVHLEAALAEADAALAKIETLMQNLPFEQQRAQSQLLVHQKDYAGKVAASGVVAGVEIDRAKSQLDSAQALVNELRNRATSLQREQAAWQDRSQALRTQLELLADEIKARDEGEARLHAARARVDQAQVAVAEMQLRLDRMAVRSPIAGRVYRLIGHPGTRVGGGAGQMEGSDSSTVVTLYRPDWLQIRVDVRFEDIPKVQLGQAVQIENPALSAPLMGKVLFIGSEADIQKNTLQVKVEIPVPPAVLKPEMLMDVTFLAPPASTIDEATPIVSVFVPEQLLSADESGPFVWLADQSSGVARKTRIQTGGRATNGLVQVLSGLNISSRVIVNGSEGLRDGDRVRVTGEAAGVGMNQPPAASESKATSIPRLRAGGTR